MYWLCMTDQYFINLNKIHNLFINNKGLLNYPLFRLLKCIFNLDINPEINLRQSFLKKLNMNKTFMFLLISILLLSVKSQNPTQDWLSQWVPWTGAQDTNPLTFCNTQAIDVTTNQAYCKTCNPPLILDPSTLLCMLDYPIDYCISADGRYNCMLCAKGYYLKYSSTTINTCISKQSACLTYDPTTMTCTSCLSGYTMNVTQNYCYFVIDSNCLAYSIDSATVCQQCVIGYQLDTHGKCLSIPKIDNCYQQTGFSCTTCSQGYSLYNNLCIKILDNCLTMNALACQQCLSGFTLDATGKCVAFTPIANCLTQVSSTCQKCITGYNLQNNLCMFLIAQCSIVNGRVCIKCNNFYMINSIGTCSPAPKVRNCAFQTNLNCTQCLSSYTLTNNQCIYSIPNCLTLNGLACQQCAPSYFIDSAGKCTASPIFFCQTQVDIVCQKCLIDYTLKSNLCVPSTPVITILNCISQTDIICNSCSSGYSLIDNACVYVINNCLVITGKLCTQCESNYQISMFGTCQFVPIFYDPNCRKFNDSSNVCLECSQNYFLYNSTCIQVDPLCKSFNNVNGVCTSCYIGYKLSDGKCLTSPVDRTTTNCNQFDFVKGLCVKCNDGAYFDANGICVSYNDDNCKVVAADRKTCQECYNGFTFDANLAKCVVNQLNCATWKNGLCATCPQGFYLSFNFSCLVVDLLCKTFNPTTQKCALCYPGYGIDTDSTCKQVSLLSGNLQKYYLNCAQYNQLNKCSSCYNGYYLTSDSNGTFCSKVSDSCRTYNSSTGKCTTCYLGYYRDANGACIAYY